MDILLASRQIALEAAPIVYSTSRFNFSALEEFLMFLNTTPLKHLESICTIRMELSLSDPLDRPAWEDFRATDVLARLRRLSSLTMWLTVRPSSGPQSIFPSVLVDEELNSSKTLPMLKFAGLRVSVYGRMDRRDYKEMASQYMKQMRDSMVGDIS